jgi:hypothetical protein
MQKLAGLITENQFKQLNENDSNLYQRILELYINSQDADSFFDDTHKKEVALYLNSLKSNPKVKTVEELASAIKKIDDTINELTDYPGDLFDEEVKPSLEQIVSDNPNLKNAVDEVLVVLNKLYGREDNEDDDDDDDEFGWNTDYDEY